MTISLITPDGGEILQVGSLRTRILEDGSGTAGRLGIVEVTIPPGDAGPPPRSACRTPSATPTPTSPPSCWIP